MIKLLLDKQIFASSDAITAATRKILSTTRTILALTWFCHLSMYRVFIKEGQKVKAYQTAKICLFRASIEFILTTTYEHLFIYTKDFKYFT